jgi:DNA-binding PadR family transcriptional regulator
MSTAYPLEGPWAWRKHHHGRWAQHEHRAGRGGRRGPDPDWSAEQGAEESSRRREGGPRGRGRRHGFGFPFGPPFGPGFGPGFGRGGRARRGDVRAAILALLAQEPMHGYQLMQEIAARSNGVWQPSAGSVYPALSLLEDEGLVHPVQDGDRRVFALTEAGRAYVQEHEAELTAPWDAVTGGVSDSMSETMGMMREIGFALMQVVRTGDERKVEQARGVLDQARRSLYLVLAGEGPGSAERAPGSDDSGSDAGGW